LRRLTLLTFGVLAVGAARLVAHDIPADVLVHVFVKPEGARLDVIVRAPLAAMRDLEFPVHGQGFLNFPVPEGLLRDGARLWIADALEFYEGDSRLGAPVIVATRVSLPGDRPLASFEDAAAHVRGPPLPVTTEIPWNQTLIDVWLQYPIVSDQSRFSVRPLLARLGLRVVTVLRLQTPAGAVRAFEYVGDPGLVRLDPRWHQAAGRFIRLGFDHILDGIDHLLFLLCLVIPYRQWRPLVMIVTAFTIAHSITLIASAFNLAPDALWFPPLIEMLIAASIVYMALENIVLAATGSLAPGAVAAAATADRLTRRWMIAFAFGLVHGFGFSFALKQTLQFAGSHLLTSLFAFNVGIELGQLLVLVVAIPVLHLGFRRVVAEKLGTIILSALIAHTAWHWMTERYGALRGFDWTSTRGDWVRLSARAAALALALAGLIWVGRAWRGARGHHDSSARGHTPRSWWRVWRGGGAPRRSNRR
jgi:hypothetical protein